MPQSLWCFTFLVSLGTTTPLKTEDGNEEKRQDEIGKEKKKRRKRDSMLPSDVDASFRSSQTTASETYMPELPFRLVLCFVVRQVRCPHPRV